MVLFLLALYSNYVSQHNIVTICLYNTLIESSPAVQGRGNKERGELKRRGREREKSHNFSSPAPFVRLAHTPPSLFLPPPPPCGLSSYAGLSKIYPARNKKNRKGKKKVVINHNQNLNKKEGSLCIYLRDKTTAPMNSSLSLSLSL